MEGLLRDPPPDTRPLSADRQNAPSNLAGPRHSPLALIEFEVFRNLSDVVCAVSTRAGGVSAGPFAALNVGFSTGDEPDAIRENRARICSALAISAERLVSPRQVHGARVEIVSEEDRGRGALRPETAIGECDGLVTTSRGVYFLLQSADCALVTVVAPPARGITLVHAGWKGAARGVVEEGVRALSRATGAEAPEFLAAIAPAIQSCCFEVGMDVVTALHSTPERESPRKGRVYVSLPGAIRDRLEAAGVPRDRIEVSTRCTRCERDTFFSYRRDGARAGRFGVVAGLRPAGRSADGAS